MRLKPALFLATAVLALSACNNNSNNGSTAAPVNANPAGGVTNPSANQGADPQQLVDEATAEVGTMRSDPQLTKLLQKAKGVFIVPEFGRGAFIIGGRGGAGVVVAKKDGAWTSPAFYDIGGISLGAQAGGSGGEVAFLLMTDNAVNDFMSGNKFSLNAGSGLSIVNYSANAQASWGKGDIILWSNTSGAYAGATVSVTDVNWDDNNNAAYYGSSVQPQQVLTGMVNNPKSAPLKAALP